MNFKYTLGCSGYEFSSYENWTAAEFEEHLNSCEESERSDLAEGLAEEAAEDYYNYHDGDEADIDWPLEFEVSYRGEVIGSKSVGFELSPVFSVEVSA